MSDPQADLSAWLPPGPPREVPVRAYFGPKEQFLILFGGIWALVGLGLGIGFWIGGGNPLDDLILRWRSTPTRAVPLEVAPTSSSENGRPVSKIRFQFRDDEGVTREAECITSNTELIARARSGQELPASYDPSNPTRARIDGAKRSLFGLFTLIPLAMGLIGAVILYRGIGSLVQRKRLLGHGEVARGRVISVAPTKVSVNRRPLIEVRYTFASLRGEVEGRSRGFLEPPVGSEVLVLYDLAAPGRNILVQPSDFQT